MAFFEKIKAEGLKDADFIFNKLFFDNAFIYSATLNEVLY